MNQSRAFGTINMRTWNARLIFIPARNQTRLMRLYRVVKLCREGLHIKIVEMKESMTARTWGLFLATTRVFFATGLLLWHFWLTISWANARTISQHALIIGVLVRTFNSCKYLTTQGRLNARRSDIMNFLPHKLSTKPYRMFTWVKGA